MQARNDGFLNLCYRDKLSTYSSLPQPRAQTEKAGTSGYIPGSHPQTTIYSLTNATMASQFRNVQSLRMLQWDVDVGNQDVVPHTSSAGPSDATQETEETFEPNEEADIQGTTRETGEAFQPNDEDLYTEGFHIGGDAGYGDKIDAEGFDSDAIDSKEHGPNDGNDSSGIHECEGSLDSNILGDDAQDYENSDLNTGMDVTMASRYSDSQQDYTQSGEDEGDSDDEDLFIVSLVYIGSAMLTRS